MPRSARLPIMHGTTPDPADRRSRNEATARRVGMGKAIVLARGHYVVMIVGQAVDDNYLKLTVR
jgi:hypothetical protein